MRLRNSVQVIETIYRGQVSRSKKKGWPLPTYSKNELVNYAHGLIEYKLLYFNWIKNNRDKKWTPSFDRINDHEYYTLENIQLVPWWINNLHGHVKQIDGRNTKLCKPVIQLSKEGMFIKEHHSTESAGRHVGISASHISKVCNGIKHHNTSAGFKWEWKSVYSPYLRQQ